MISAVLNAKNEQGVVRACLESIKWVDEIVVVDSGSVDHTPDIARSFGAKHSFNRDFRGHAAQKNVALDKCTCEWILLLDADEVLSPELAEEIKQTLEDPKFEAYWIPRLNLFLGRWMRHGGVYPDRKLRLFKRGRARVQEGVGPHGTPQYDGPKGTLKHDLMHYAYPTLELYLDHMNAYSSEITEVIVKSGKTSRSLVAFVWNGVLNPIATFIKNYIFRLGFLDGREGFLFHLNHSFYIHWKYAKAWEAVQKTVELPAPAHAEGERQVR